MTSSTVTSSPKKPHFPRASGAAEHSSNCQFKISQLDIHFKPEIILKQLVTSVGDYRYIIVILKHDQVGFLCSFQVFI